ncbi:universal stress protein [Aquimarina intermedia]|uniref:Nucleotide-binding universal stress UspA family protein n=1 Tax=Aquimarina intermedia TaxID=350814 RepID=A0A5S5C4N6_9FLAO|nr:universal stress protein [Aquimarina intermedia]TYP74277.1 nucleotide-binding universal stress UspA family protein [Aquimarina intermedia]
MKKILIPTDFSENSWNAIQYAVAFFKKTQCTFYLLHVASAEDVVIDDAMFQVENEHEALLTDNLTSDAKNQLKSLVKRIEKLPLNTKHTFEPLLEYIFFVDGIRKNIVDKQIDFIVMGTKGATNALKRAIGSNTGDVITKVKCPVLVIPENATYKRPKEIAFPTDYNINYKTRVLDTLTQLLVDKSAALRVLHVAKKDETLSDNQQNNKDFLDRHLGDTIPHSFHFLSNSSIEHAVQCFVESRDIDMITMVAKNLNFFQRILFHPLVEEISYHTDIPFLVLHE